MKSKKKPKISKNMKLSVTFYHVIFAGVLVTTKAIKFDKKNLAKFQMYPSNISFIDNICLTNRQKSICVD